MLGGFGVGLFELDLWLVQTMASADPLNFGYIVDLLFKRLYCEHVESQICGNMIIFYFNIYLYDPDGYIPIMDFNL